MTQNQTIYELTVILKPDLGAETLEQKTRGLIAFISELKGSIKKEEVLREIALAYPVKKYKRGFLWTSYFILENAAAAQAILSKLNTDSAILSRAIIKRRAIPKSQNEILLEKQTAKLKTEVAPTIIENEEALQKPLKESLKRKKATKSKLKKKAEITESTKTKLEEIDKKIEELLVGEIK